VITVKSKLQSGFAFSPTERYFSPAMGKKGEIYLSAGEKWEKLPDVLAMVLPNIFVQG